jgi:hypothetical protein
VANDDAALGGAERFGGHDELAFAELEHLGADDAGGADPEEEGERGEDGDVGGEPGGDGPVTKVLSSIQRTPSRTREERAALMRMSMTRAGREEKTSPTRMMASSIQPPR